MNERRLERWLAAAIDLWREEDDEDPVRDVEDFVQAGVLTTNRGLVITLEDGTEFQVTIVRSRTGRS